MASYKKAFIIGIAAISGVFCLGYQSQSAAKQSLTIGGGRAHFGVHQIRGGFMPDPRTISVTSGGNLAVTSMGLGSGCRGYATATPDAIVHYANPAGFLRFFVRAASGGDTTLVINDARGRWHCDDDGGGSLNPMVDISNPPGGQYDIWVGSYRAGEQIRGTLHVTELRSQRP